MKLYFNINFFTKKEEILGILITDEEGKEKSYKMDYSDSGNWKAEVDYFSRKFSYKYQVFNAEDKIVDEEYISHALDLPHNYKEFLILDSWNNKNFPENYLNNKIFLQRFENFQSEKVNILKKHTHLFRIEAPLYHPNWRMVILGNVPALGNWEYLKTLPMMQTSAGVWEVAVQISEDQIISYKYGIMDTTTGEVFDVEYGDNRWTFANTDKNTLQIKADHYFKYKSFELYHAAGVAVPVFSLRSKKGFGVGEFSDLKALGDWAQHTHQKMIQILPINDTTADYSWKDSYPYAAISVYALHPIYLSLENLNFTIPKELRKEYEKEKEELNALSLMNYERVISGKWKYLKVIFKENNEAIMKDNGFKNFLKGNTAWLLPYAAFCVQRDLYKTPDFNQWKTHKKYIAGKISPFFSAKSKNYQAAMLHAWVQYQLHLQLSDAVDYLHKLDISLKGDLPIGIFRNSVEAWTEPELFGMDFQAGAPPDQFTQAGQNWGFPTYNWEAMKADGYQWWKNRLHALEKYFDAMRIDHILGFFRIWRIPVTATQGILGYFYPAVPITEEEFAGRQLPFDKKRYCTPYINDQILWNYFGDERENIHQQFMNNHFDGTYSFKEEFDTQRKLRDYFDQHPHPWAEDKLISLCANVLFLIEEREGKPVYHPRFNLHQTDSYHSLPDWEKERLYSLYLDYFFQRQENLWYHSAMEKLPMILNASKMLICGEDLGFVPDAVPLVMDKLGIVALKVQRMPKENIPWYNPKDAGYLNVVTTSSHDSSTMRQWWLENRTLSVRYFKEQLLQKATAPGDYPPALAELVIKQHLYNDAMLAIFPIQEYFAMDEDLVNPNRDEERINDPGVFPHYWRYRMHIDLEALSQKQDFNKKVAFWIQDSGRG